MQKNHDKRFIINVCLLILWLIVESMFLLTDFCSAQAPSSVKCGDGICDEKEKANPNLCPKDCTNETSSVQMDFATPSYSKLPKFTGAATENSPFAIFGLYEWKLDTPNAASVSDINNYLTDLGVKWVEEMYLTRDLIHTQTNINIYSRVGREGGNRPPETTGKYEEELKKVINTYKERIKYWEVGTEPSGYYSWGRYPKEYAVHLQKTYKVIKENCRDCYVVFGGMYGSKEFTAGNRHARFLKKVLEAGGGEYFDVFEFKLHNHTAADYTELKNIMKVYGKLLGSYGVDIKKIPVFIETAMYDGKPGYPAGNPLSKLNFPFQTEQQQAAGLLKTYVYGLANGIDKIFWNLIIERHNFGGNPTNQFNFFGLVHNPANDDGKSHKKLSYYTYKKMVEILEGSDWHSIQTLQDGNGIYIFQFTKAQKHIWVAWNETGRTETIRISQVGGANAKITPAVSAKESGKDVMNYSSAFESARVAVYNGELNLSIKNNIPVFIEEE
jgi:RET, Cysteine Rich Domain